MPDKQPDGTYNETIDDIDYNFQMWGAEDALRIGIMLGAIASGSVKAAGDAVRQAAEQGSEDDGGKVQDLPKAVKASLMAQVIGSLFASMGDRRAESMEVIKALATLGVKRIDPDGKQRAVASVNGGFNNAYRGKLAHLRKVVTAAAEVQYADFFSDVGGFLTAS